MMMRGSDLEEQPEEQPTGKQADGQTGKRSSRTWFVLRYLLGFENVKNYDGSWTEWGNLGGAPIERGEANEAQA